MNKLMKIFLIALTLLIAKMSMAGQAIMIIVPSTTAVTVGTGGQTTIDYTVTNNTPQMQNHFTIYPAFDISNNAARETLTVQNNTCSTLAPHASCTFQIVITASSDLPSSFVISPRVCTYNNAACSQPVAANRVNVTISGANTERYAYIVNDDSTALVCNIENNGDIDNCIFTGNGLDRPQGITISPNKTFAYITNAQGASDFISKCSFASDGGLINCAQTAISTNFVRPRGIAVNPSGNIVYIGANNDNWTCHVNSNGSLSACTSQVNGTTTVPGVSVMPNNKFAYFSYYNETLIGICSIGAGGVLSCNNQSFSDHNRGTAVNPTSTIIYISSSSGLDKCNINSSDGTLNCVNAFLTPPEPITLNSTGTWLYLVNPSASDSAITKCTILSNGDVGTCTDTGICAASNPDCFIGSANGIALR